MRDDRQVNLDHGDVLSIIPWHDLIMFLTDKRIDSVVNGVDAFVISLSSSQKINKWEDPKEKYNYITWATFSARNIELDYMNLIWRLTQYLIIYPFLFKLRKLKIRVIVIFIVIHKGWYCTRKRVTLAMNELIISLRGAALGT